VYFVFFLFLLCFLCRFISLVLAIRLAGKNVSEMT